MPNVIITDVHLACKIVGLKKECSLSTPKRTGNKTEQKEFLKFYVHLKSCVLGSGSIHIVSIVSAQRRSVHKKIQ